MSINDLDLVQGQRYQRGFRLLVGGTPRDLTPYSWRSQIRSKDSVAASLILDLAPYLSLDVDGSTLRLVLPASVTYALEPRKFRDETSWDLFLWPTAAPDEAFLFIQGHASLDPATSAL